MAKVIIISSMGLVSYLKIHPSQQALPSWGRYLYWADLRQRDWEKYMAENDGNRDFVPGWLGANCYFGASLYVVIEGWEATEFKDPIIEALLGLSNYKDVLRRLRNFTFHYQPELLSPKFLDFFRAEDAILWVDFLHEEFCRWLRDCIKAVETEGLFSPEKNVEWRASVVDLLGWLPQRLGDEQLKEIEVMRAGLEKQLSESDSQTSEELREKLNACGRAVRTIAAHVREYRRKKLAKLGLNPDDYLPLEN
jgi:hypothetical protein